MNNVFTRYVILLTSLVRRVNGFPWAAIVGILMSTVILVPLMLGNPKGASTLPSNADTLKTSVQPKSSQKGPASNQGNVAIQEPSQNQQGPPPNEEMTFSGASTQKQPVELTEIPDDFDSRKLLYCLLAVLCSVAAVWITSATKLEVNGEQILPPRDPQDFIELLKYNAKAIELLETPRRIKRFCNRLRLHHNLLNKGMLSEIDLANGFNMQLYFELLLLFELDRNLESDKKIIQECLKCDEETFLKKMCIKAYYPTYPRILSWDKNIAPVSPFLEKEFVHHFGVLINSTPPVLDTALRRFFVLNRDTVI